MIINIITICSDEGKGVPRPPSGASIQRPTNETP